MCLIPFYILYYMYCFAFPCSLSLIFTLFPNSALYIFPSQRIYSCTSLGHFFCPFLHLFSSLSPSQHAELWWINLSEEQCHYKHGCIPLCMCMCVCKRVSLGKLVCTHTVAESLPGGKQGYSLLFLLLFQITVCFINAMVIWDPLHVWLLCFSKWRKAQRNPLI